MIIILYLWIGSYIFVISFILLMFLSFAFYFPEGSHVGGRNM